MNAQTAIVTMIHGQLGTTLQTVFGGGSELFRPGNPRNPFQILAPRRLVDQLRAGDPGSPDITLELALGIGGNALAALVEAAAGGPSAAAATTIRNAVQGRLGLFDTHEGAIVSLFTDPSPERLRAFFADIRTTIVPPVEGGVPPVLAGLQGLIGHDEADISMVFPLATISQVTRGLIGIPDTIKANVLKYFFNHDGYTTIDGVAIVAPAHLSDIRNVIATNVAGGASGKGLSGLFSMPTAERFLRDIIRVIVESTYNAGRNLLISRDEVTRELVAPPADSAIGSEILAKFGAWFKGFASIAESAAMRAVEVGTQGVSEFQTNALIAAAAGTFAGTVARKFAHDSFLTLLRVELGLPLR